MNPLGCRNEPWRVEICTPWGAEMNHEGVKFAPLGVQKWTMKEWNLHPVGCINKPQGLQKEPFTTWKCSFWGAKMNLKRLKYAPYKVQFWAHGVQNCTLYWGAILNPKKGCNFWTPWGAAIASTSRGSILNLYFLVCTCMLEYNYKPLLAE